MGAFERQARNSCGDIWGRNRTIAFKEDREAQQEVRPGETEQDSKMSQRSSTSAE